MNTTSGIYELRILDQNARGLVESMDAARETICKQKKELEEVVRAFNGKLQQLVEDELKARGLSYCTIKGHFASGELILRITQGSRSDADGEIRFHRLHRVCKDCVHLLAAAPDKVIPGVQSLDVQPAEEREGKYFLNDGQQLGGTVTIGIDFVSRKVFDTFAAELGLPSHLYIMTPETEPSLGGGTFPKTAVSAA